MTLTTTKPTTIPAGKPVSLVIELSPERALGTIQDLRCVTFSNRGPGERALTIGEALGVLSGHGGDEPAHAIFLRTGKASSPCASYQVLGTPEEVAERLAAYRAYSDECFRKAMGSK